MKNLSIILISFFLVSCAALQPVKTERFDAVYELSFSDKVRIRTGGATQERSSKEWKGGGTVGTQGIPKEVFEKLESSLAESYKLELASKTVANIKDAFITDLSTNKRTKGIYNTQTREFLFSTGADASQSNNKDCGAISLGSIKGKLSADMQKIENGEIGVGFFAGCAPIIITADATFFFTGKTK